MVLVHGVLISFKDGVLEEEKDKIYDLYQKLDQECGGVDAGILYWKFAKNLDLRKGVHLFELALFRDNTALQAFRVHPKHKELTDILSQIADWKVGDYMEDALVF